MERNSLQTNILMRKQTKVSNKGFHLIYLFTLDCFPEHQEAPNLCCLLHSARDLFFPIQTRLGKSISSKNCFLLQEQETELFPVPHLMTSQGNRAKESATLSPFVEAFEMSGGVSRLAQRFLKLTNSELTSKLKTHCQGKGTASQMHFLNLF